MTDRAPIPDVLLERYRLGELPPGEAAPIAERIHVDSVLRERLEALGRSDDDLRTHGVIATIADGVQRRVSEAAPRSAVTVRRRRTASWLVLAATAAAIAIAVVARSSSPRSDSGGDRIKGLRPALTLYRHTAGGSETLADGATARRGDLVRIGYRPAGRAFGVIFSVDGNRTVTMHLPVQGGRAVPLAHEPTVLLDQAYELDDAPLWERFYFVTGDAPFEVAPIVSAARAAPLSAALPRGLEHATFALQKEATP